MRENSRKREDNTANQRMQRRIQKHKDAGGRAFSMLIDQETSNCLQLLISKNNETQKQIVSRLIREAAQSIN